MGFVQSIILLPDIPHCSLFRAGDPELPEGGVIPLPPTPSGQTGGWVIRSDRDGELATVEPNQESYTVDEDSLSLGRHVITVETEDGVVVLRFTVTVPRECKSADVDWLECCIGGGFRHSSTAG